MTDRVHGSRRPNRWRKRAGLFLALLVLLGSAVVFGIPWWLSTGSGRAWLLGRASSALAPARLEVASFSWSWWGPTRMRGFVLRDHQGDTVVSSPTAEWDRTLWQAIFDQPRLGNLRLNTASLDIERLDDGSIDLLEALRPILWRNPKTSFTLLVADGRLRLRCPELAEPVLGHRVELRIDCASDPGPLSWRLRLKGNPDLAASKDAFFECDGTVDKSLPDRGAREASIALRSSHWPIAAKVGATDVIMRGSLQGSAVVTHKSGAWSTKGDAKLADLAFVGPGLQGDQPRFEELQGTWNLTRSSQGWQCEELSLHAPGVTLDVQGGLPVAAHQSTRIEGELDLAALARQLPHTLRLHDDLRVDSGKAHVRLAGTRDDSSTTQWELSAQMTDLEAHRGAARFTIEAPARFDAKLREEASRLTVEQFEIESAFLKAKGQGDVDQGITLAGTVELEGLARQLRDFVDLGAIEPRGAGNFSADYRRTKEEYAGRVTLDLAGLNPPVQADRARAVREFGLDRAGALHLTASISGPASPEGWPLGWREVTSVLKSESLNATLNATADESGMRALNLVAQPGSPDGNSSLLAEARLQANRQGRIWLIDEASLVFNSSPTKRHAQLDPIVLAATGRYDPDAGEAVLHPTRIGEREALYLSNRGIRIRGINSNTWQAEGELYANAAVLDRVMAAWNDREPLGLAGDLSLAASLVGTSETTSLHATLRSNDLARLGPDSKLDPLAPISFEIGAAYDRANERVEMQQIEFTSPYGSARASGQIDDPWGSRLLDLSGTLSPNYERLTRFLAENVEPAARIEGNAHPFFVRGPLTGDVLAGLEAEVGFDVRRLDLYGMRVGPTPLVLAWINNAAAIAPIDTSLNGGRLVLKPELSRAPDRGVWSFRILPGSFLDNAEVNDEVSHRVLAYVAPVLDRATIVNGHVSAAIEKFEIPLTADAAKQTVVEGAVVFHDVTFGPGPMAMQLYNVVGLEPAELRLDQPVVLSIADGQVYQRGFSLPLAGIARMRMEGVVGFDRSLALNVTVPMAAERFASVPVFNRIAPALRLEFPIRGTLSDPKIDGKAMGKAMGRMGLDVAEGAGFGGIEALVRGLAIPKDPEEEARMQAEREERQRLRREKQEMRKEEQRLKREERKKLRGTGA